MEQLKDNIRAFLEFARIDREFNNAAAIISGIIVTIAVIAFIVIRMNEFGFNVVLLGIMMGFIVGCFFGWMLSTEPEYKPLFKIEIEEQFFINNSYESGYIVDEIVDR